jgi:hypothetical protein
MLARKGLAGLTWRSLSLENNRQVSRQRVVRMATAQPGPWVGQGVPMEKHKSRALEGAWGSADSDHSLQHSGRPERSGCRQGWCQRQHQCPACLFSKLKKLHLACPPFGYPQSNKVTSASGGCCLWGTASNKTCLS